MARTKGGKVKLLKGEIAMYFVIVALIVLIPVINVYTSAIVTRTNLEVESLKKDINTQEKEIESLSMQRDELASLDKIQAVAKEYGLSYNNTNILQVK